jgi:hypothetical protein
VAPALAAFGFYALVTPLGRYVGVFVVLFWADLLANVRLPGSQVHKKVASWVSAIMILSMLASLAAFNLEGFRAFSGTARRRPAAGPQPQRLSWPGEVSEALHRLGVGPGSRVAVIGYSFESFWARLARVKIVAEMLEYEADGFWFGDPAVQSEVIQAFASTEADAVVAEYVPRQALMTGWHRVGESSYYIYLLDR